MPVTLPLLACALHLAAAPPAAQTATTRIDVPFTLTASAPASNVETTVQPWFGVRGGQLHALDADPQGMSAGFDVALLVGGFAREGTPQVSTSRVLAAVEGRGLWSPVRVRSTFTTLLPYGFVGALLGGGGASVDAFDDHRLRGLVTWGARAGAGVDLVIHGVVTRIELGAGARDLRLELSSSLALGLAF